MIYCSSSLASAFPTSPCLTAGRGRPYRFEVDPSDVDELPPALGTPVADYVALLAWKKAGAVALRRGTGLILAADTACAVGDEILNKPHPTRAPTPSG